MLIIFSTLIFMSLKLGCERAVRRTWLRRNDDSHKRELFFWDYGPGHIPWNVTSTVAFSAHFSTQQSSRTNTRFLRASSAHNFTSFACNMNWNGSDAVEKFKKLPNDLTSFSLSWAIFTIIGLSLVASNTLSLSEVEHLLVLDIFTVLSEIIIHFTCLIWCWWGVQKQSFLEGIRWLWQIQRI